MQPYKIRLGQADAAVLAERTVTLAGAAEELSRFHEGSPELAALCGIETAALEARLILSGGACARLSEAARAAQEGRAAEVSLSDVSALSRLETVLSLGEARIGAQIAELDAATQTDGVERIGNFVGMASGVIGLVKSIF